MKKFSISFSTEKYQQKPGVAEVKNMKFHRQNSITVGQLAERVREGYSICGCFNTKNDLFGLAEKTEANFALSNWVWVDIDDSTMSMTEVLRKLQHSPTIAYTTASDGKDGKFRFRLGYLFDASIESVSVYKQIYAGITESILRSIPDFVIKDNCCKSPAQMIHGNGTGKCHLEISEQSLYQQSDFPCTKNHEAKMSIGRKMSRPKIKISDEHFMSDFKNLKFQDIIDKYRDRYTFFERTKLDYENGFAIIPEDYNEIHRRWYKDKVLKTDGTEYPITAIKKLNDGDGRRKNLYIGGLIRKKIMPDITFEHLLYNLVCECEWFYRNADGVLTKKVLIETASNVISTPLDQITVKSINRKKYEVDKSYCQKSGLNTYQMSNKARKYLKDIEIGNILDISIDIQENLENLRKLGVKVGRSRLYKYYKEHNLPLHPVVR